MRWLLAAVVLVAIAWALQAGLVIYAAVTLGLVAVANRWLAGEGLQHIEAERVLSRHEVAVGETVEVKIRLHHAGSRPLVWLLFEDLLPEDALAQRPPRLTVKGRRLRVRSLRAGQSTRIDYKVTFRQRGVYPVGPLVVESGDLFGFFRRYRVLAPPQFVTVLPRVESLTGYEIASRRPIGDVRLTHRLYEDPTRIAGVRPYMQGDPLNRIHWRATGRTGRLHSKVFDATSLAGATLLVDYHADGYPPRGEPFRSELVATTAASLAHAILEINQQVGLWSNGGDASRRWVSTMVDRIRKAARVPIDEEQFQLADDLRHPTDVALPASDGDVLGVPTRRGWQQFGPIRQILARLEPSDRLPFAGFVWAITPRLPRDATALAVVPAVPELTALALGNLRRAGLAVAVVLVLPAEDTVPTALSRLAAEGIRDVRVLEHESQLPELCQAQARPSVVPLLG